MNPYPHDQEGKPVLYGLSEADYPGPPPQFQRMPQFGAYPAPMDMSYAMRYPVVARPPQPYMPIEPTPMMPGYHHYMTAQAQPKTPMRPPIQPTLSHLWNQQAAAAVQQQHQSPPPQAAYSPPTPQQQRQSHNGVPPNSYLVSYDALSSAELDALQSSCPTNKLAPPTSDQGNESITTARDLEPPNMMLEDTSATSVDSLRATSCALSCEVCQAFEPLPDLGQLSQADLFRAGRHPRQSHQCAVCGVVAHRACYGVTHTLSDKPIFGPSKRASVKKFASAPQAPLFQGFIERPVMPPNRTPHCRFVCDLCQHLACIAATSTRGGVDFGQQIPLGGRCYLCGQRKGPRKWVEIDRVENSPTPKYCFAHPFCIVTASRGICEIRDWRTLEGIRISEAVLLQRKAQIESRLKSQYTCTVCRETCPENAFVGLGLEFCRFFRKVRIEIWCRLARCLRLLTENTLAFVISHIWSTLR